MKHNNIMGNFPMSADKEACGDLRAAGSAHMGRNRATPDGRELGKHLARFCDEAEPKARLKIPELPPRCSSCAFRQGDHIPNGSPTTQMDALKCLIEGHEFYCHEPARDGALCSGWSMMMLAKDEADFATVSWPFSDESGERGG